MLEFTAAGYIEVWRDGALVSRHRLEREAYQSIEAHAEAHGDGDYLVRFPEVRVSRLTRRLPITFAASGSAAGASVPAAGGSQILRSTAAAGGSTVVGATGSAVVASGGNELADWNARVSSPGVLWAQRFQSQGDIDRWISPTWVGTSRAPSFQSGQGHIPGDGCMRQTVPVGTGVAGATQWSRPMQPQPGDINQPGVALGTGDTWINEWNKTTRGYIANAAYSGSHGSPARTKVIIGNEFWFQFRLRFSAARFDNAAAQSKMLYLSCNYEDPTQELVLHGKGGAQGNTGLITQAFSCYTNFNGFPNGGLEEPQSNGPSTGQREPGGFPLCTVGNPGACYVYQPGVWQTVLVHFVPGTHNAANSTLEIYCAREGETSYTLVHRKTNYLWIYDDTAASVVGYHAYGFSYLMLNPFTGGGGWATNNVEWYHEFDQLIFSLQTIPCPGSMPSWYPAVGTVVDISAATANSATQFSVLDSLIGSTYPALTGVSSRLTPYSGGALVYVGGLPYLFMMGGGHDDGSWNGAMRYGPLFGSGSNAPTWSVGAAASTAAIASAGKNTAVYSDGRPGSQHTYNILAGVGQHIYGSMISIFYSNPALNDPRPWRYDTLNQTWTVYNSQPNPSVGTGTGSGCVAYNGKIYFLKAAGDNERLRIFDPTVPSWAVEPSGGITVYGAPMMAADSNRGAILLLSGSTNFGLYWSNLTTFPRSSAGITVPTNQKSLIFDPYRDTFVCTVSGSLTVYETSAQRLADGNGTSWTARTFTGTTPAASFVQDGSPWVYGRCQYVPELRGYIVAPSHDTHVYFYRST